MIVITDNLRQSIIRHEGYEPKVYNDSRGIATIGFGFAIKDLELSRTVCRMILDEKLERLAEALSAALPDINFQPAVVRDVIIEMAYQLGIHGLLKFRTSLQLLSQKKYASAADEFMNSEWAKQTPNRAKELTDRIRSLGDQ